MYMHHFFRVNFISCLARFSTGCPSTISGLNFHLAIALNTDLSNMLGGFDSIISASLTDQSIVIVNSTVTLPTILLRSARFG